MIFAKYSIPYTYSIEFKQSIILLKLHVWSIIFVLLNNDSWQWYIAENLQHLATIRLFMGVFINVILNYIWIQKFGLVAAVYATLVSYSIATYFDNLFSKKLSKIL